MGLQSASPCATEALSAVALPRCGSRLILDPGEHRDLDSLPLPVVPDGLTGPRQDPLQYRGRSAPPLVYLFGRPRLLVPLRRLLAVERLPGASSAVRRAREVVVEAGAVRLDDERVLVVAVVVETEVPPEFESVDLEPS